MKSSAKNLIKKLINRNQVLYSVYLLFNKLKIRLTTQEDICNDVVAYRIDRQRIVGIESSVSGDSLKCFPEKIIVEKGLYSFQGLSYDCSLPGLYRFVLPGKKNRQHVVLDCEDPIASTLYLSLISVRGNSDEGLTHKNQEKRAIARFLSLTCWHNSILVKRLLDENGVRSRVVSSHTVEEKNSYNNGHVLVEVFSVSLQKYVVVDVDKKAIYVDGQPLSLFELCRNIYEGRDFSIEPISHVTMVDWNGFREKDSSFSYGFVEYAFNNNQDTLKSCISRICQIPIIEADGQLFACAWDSRLVSRVRDVSKYWTILSPDKFYAMFYEGIIT